MDNRLHDKPSDVEAESGEVQVNGPAGVSVSLTPDAAEKTGKKLVEKAADARDQQKSDTEALVSDDIEDMGNFA